MEKIMHKRLLSLSNNYSVINNKQHGSCEGKTTKTAIVDFIERVYKSLDKSIGLFLDLSKAFDLVNHDILLRKMARMGIPGVALKWFQTYIEKKGAKSGNYI
jgi:hypothetical protein